jgi:branched-subunit amino acid aminotransferase/4-amino-4-deoxychorismate lyase
MDSFSGIKTLNAARYVQAARDAKLQGWDDAVLLNAAERVCEATSSNLFWWEKGELRTVALEEGCVAGVFRAFLMEEAPRLGILVKTTTLLPEQLTELEGLFLTNSIRGIVPAKFTRAHLAEDQTRYLAEEVYQRLLKED